MSFIQFMIIAAPPLPAILMTIYFPVFEIFKNYTPFLGIKLDYYVRCLLILCDPGSLLILMSSVVLYTCICSNFLLILWNVGVNFKPLHNRLTSELLLKYLFIKMLPPILEH